MYIMFTASLVTRTVGSTADFFFTNFCASPTNGFGGFLEKNGKKYWIFFNEY